MSTEANKSIAREFFAALSRRDVDAAVALLADDYVGYQPGAPAPLGREAVGPLLNALLAAFPDFQSTVEDQIAEGDKVVNRFTASGTQQGEFFGIPATGRHVTYSGIEILRFAGGKIAENHTSYDQLGMLRQLGAVPG
jgi:steroid delta-isomerase-like uncharacterized protein